MKKQAIDKLRAIGLNQLEAEVYYLLLSDKPMTAYKVGKLLKKPTANIYKAVEVLYDKGAVVIEEGNKKLCKAIDPQEFIAVQQRNFTETAQQVSDALTNIRPNPEEEKTYSLDSVGLALEKAKKMIESARVIIVVDAFPRTLEAIKGYLESAAKRGVKVVIQSYHEITIEGADIFITSNYDEVISYWQSQQLNVVVDGRESLIALFDNTMSDVFHATWSNNIYLSCIMHAGRLCEQTIHKLMALPDSDDKLKKMEQILQEQLFFRNSDVPGVQELFNRYLMDKTSKPVNDAK